MEDNQSGFVDQRILDLRNSLNDAKQSIAGKKNRLGLVDARNQADVVLQVIERRVDPSGRFESTASGYSGRRGQYRSATGQTREITLYNVRAVITPG